MREIFLLGFGAPLVDILLKTDDDFIRRYVGEKGGMDHWSIEKQQSVLEMAGEYTVANGGSAGNTVNCLANLGGPCAMLGMIGDDELGSAYKAELRASGGEDKYIFRNVEAATGRCISFITPDSERTMRSNLGASSLVRCEDIDRVDFSEVGIVYFEGYRLFEEKSFDYALNRAMEAGCRIAIDLASYNVVEIFHDKLYSLYENGVFDMIFANEEEAAAFFGNSEHEKNIREMMKHCSIAVIKLGRDGSLIAHDSQVYHIAALPCNAVDSTGAGDAYAGGFFYGLYRDFDMAKCGEIAARVSSAVVAVEGAKLDAESWKTIREHYK